jgi:hypothetical protein
MAILGNGGRDRLYADLGRLAQLTALPDVKRDIAVVARIMEAGTLIMSAGLNALAFTGGAFDAAHWAQVAFGCFRAGGNQRGDLHPGTADAAVNAGSPADRRHPPRRSWSR